MLQGKLYHSTVCVNTRVLIMHGAFNNIVPSAKLVSYCLLSQQQLLVLALHWVRPSDVLP